MALPINLHAAMNSVRSSRTNLEKISNLNKFVEEFYKTVGILFLTRYNTLFLEENLQYDPDVITLIKDRFSSPHQFDWMQLCKLCGESLSVKGDFFAKEFHKISQNQLNPEDSEIAKTILKEINLVKSNLNFIPPKKVSMAQILEIMRELRNFTAHEWTSNTHLKSLINSKVDLFIIEKVQLFFSQLPIKFIKILSISNQKIDICILDGVTKSTQSEPYPIEGLPIWDATYINFDQSEDLLKFFTFLLWFDEERNHIFVYTSGSKEKKNFRAKFDNLPISGDIQKNKLEFKSIFDLFSIPIDMSLPEVIETASQKYGKISENNGVIHNLPELSPTYINRPMIEHELFEKISHPRLYITAMDGGGGFGKTELAKKVIWDIIDKKQEYIDSFDKLDYVIWLSAKVTYFEKGEIINKKNAFENFEDLLNCILYVTGHSTQIDRPLEEKIKFSYSIFNGLKQNIIILDNLETVSDIESIWEYLINLGKEIKTDIKVLITSRILNIHGDQRQNVRAMEIDESKELIKRELQRFALFSTYHSDKDIEKIAILSANIPFLIKQFISLLSQGYNLKELEDNIPKTLEQALEFICEYQWKGLPIESKKLLMGIAKNGGRLNFAQAKLLCDLNDTDFHEAMEKLKDRSFLVDSALRDSILETLSPITIFVRTRFALYPDIMDEIYDHMDLIKIKSSIKTDPTIESFLYTDEIALNNFLQKADMLIRRGEIPAAYKWYNEAIKRFPSNSLSWSSLGDFEFKYMDDDEKARSSYERAISLDSKNYIIFKNFAYWEADRGVKQQKRQYIKRSIELNEKAIQLVENDIIKKIIIDHIASAYMKLGYMDKQEAYKSKDAKNRYFDNANKYFKKVLEILNQNIYSNPVSSEEIRHNILDYSMMVNAYVQLGSKKDSMRQYYNDLAILTLIKALKLDRDNDKTLSFLNIRSIRDTFAFHHVSIGNINADLIDKILALELILTKFVAEKKHFFE